MNRIALITGADRGLGLGLVKNLLERDWKVLAGRNLDWPELDELKVQHPDTLDFLKLDVSSDQSVQEAALTAMTRVPCLDLLICNAGINRSAHINSIREDVNFDDMLCEVNVNALGALRMTKAFLPLLDKGSLKRLCYVSSEAGSIGSSSRTGWFGYCMSKAAVNMAVKNLSNDLGKDGYSFRLYHPGWLRTYMRGVKNTEAQFEPEEAANFAIGYFLNDSVNEDLQLRDWEGKSYPW